MDDPHILPEKLQIYINNIIKKEQYKNYTVDNRKINADGVMGQYFVVNIKETGDAARDTSVFIKHIIDNKDDMKIYSVTDIFARESFAYTKLFIVFNKLQDEANILEATRFITAKSYNETTTETLMLENLERRDFKTYDKMLCPPLKYVELSMEQLAKFHALTFVIEKQKPEFFEKIRQMRQPFNFAEEWRGFVNNMFNVSVGYLEEDVRNRVAAKLKVIVDKYPEYLQDTTTVRTLCHGDYRHPNVMVKEINNEATEVIPIDFQLLHYGCPVIDFLYFIFSSTDHCFRAKHLDHLKSLYYESLGTFLKHFNIEADIVYPREEFENTFKKMLDFGLMINMFYIPFQFSLKDQKPDVTNELSTITFKIDDRFRDRLRGTVKQNFIHGRHHNGISRSNIEAAQLGY